MHANSAKKDDKKNNHSKKSGLSLKPRKYFFRDLIIVIGVVLVWRGFWLLADRFLFPHNSLLSEIVSIALGLFLLYLPDKDLSHLTGDRHQEHHHYHHYDQKQTRKDVPPQ